MIHGYLIAHNMESEENDYHCENFIRKMNEINAKTNLNITVSENETNCSMVTLRFSTCFR